MLIWFADVSSIKVLLNLDHCCEKEMIYKTPSGTCPSLVWCRWHRPETKWKHTPVCLQVKNTASKILTPHRALDDIRCSIQGLYKWFLMLFYTNGSVQSCNGIGRISSSRSVRIPLQRLQIALKKPLDPTFQTGRCIAHCYHSSQVIAMTTKYLHHHL